MYTFSLQGGHDELYFLGSLWPHVCGAFLQIRNKQVETVSATSPHPNLNPSRFSSAYLELARSLGAHEVIDYRSQGFAHLRDIDLILDTIGGETLAKSWSVLRPKGRIATLIDFAIQPTGDKTGEYVFFKSATESLPEAVELFNSGHLQIATDSIFSLDSVRAGLKKVAAGHARGKVIIRAKYSA